MATYTGVADNNGNFTIPFTENYTSGQKVTVTAEKDGDSKSIELFAPSGVVGGSCDIRVTGSMVDFPNNIDEMILSESFTGKIQNSSFRADINASEFFKKIKGLTILGSINRVGNSAFHSWSACSKLILPNSLKHIEQYAFNNWTSLTSLNIPNSVEVIEAYAFQNCGASTLTLPANPLFKIIPSSCFMSSKFTEVVVPDSVEVLQNSSLRLMSLCTKITVGSGVTQIQTVALNGNAACLELIMKPISPPVLANNITVQISPSGLIKVPSGSLSAYKAAPFWSELSSQIVAI